MAVGYQSFYQAELTANISETDTTIPLNVVPTVDEGFLVIESTVPSKREIIYFTSKTSNSVVVPSGAGNGRGYDGTTAVTHLQGAAVIMAPVGAMFSELRQQFTTTPQGWTNMAQNITGVTANGNGSYDLTFDASVASILSDGMRLQITKSVAGNGYMGGLFNGSSHYFTKTSPSGALGTVTNNFTIEAVVQPTSYAAGIICSRADATTANGFYLNMLATGQIEIGVKNAGVGNARVVGTYQSVPLNKKTTIAATWTGGTVVIYFNGISVPVAAAVTAGTAPTTAGTGGDWSIGRYGAKASNYFSGYISNVAVFDAVLSAATIRQHSTYKLIGNETNCIGAWSLDNTPNDQSSAGNNLTATGGVGYTAMTPHGQLSTGVDTTKAVALVMAVSGSTATVQVPEGCTIPTSGGVTSVSYSTQANPYGFVSDKGRWAVRSIYLTSAITGAATQNVIYNVNSVQINIPKGQYDLIGQGNIQIIIAGGGNADFVYGLSTSNSAFSDTELARFNYQATSSHYINSFYINSKVALSTTAPYYFLVRTGTTGASSLGIRDKAMFDAIPSGL